MIFVAGADPIGAGRADPDPGVPYAEGSSMKGAGVGPPGLAGADPVAIETSSSMKRVGSSSTGSSSTVGSASADGSSSVS